MVEQCAPGAIPLYIPYCSHIGALYEMLRQFYNGWRQNELSKLYYARLIEKFEKMVSPIWDFSLFIFAPVQTAKNPEYITVVGRIDLPMISINRANFIPGLVREDGERV